jgi:long-chain acyl-CoA synthetase
MSNSSAIKDSINGLKAISIDTLPNGSNALLENVEKIIANNDLNSIDRDTWSSFLEYTGKTNYLQALPDHAHRLRWSEAVFKIIQHTNFTLLDMFLQRVRENPEKQLFRNISLYSQTSFSYNYVNIYTREIASVFLSRREKPAVAIFCDNSVDSACCDLACMFYDILVTPLNTHSNSEILEWVFRQLDINIVITDTKARIEQLEKLKEKTGLDFDILSISQQAARSADMFLDGLCKQVDNDEIDALINSRKRFQLNEVATVMFTSGSTGMPKGVSFSQYNLVSKRFARAAALPKVGRDEVLLCFLPLFHTFGRYFEMLGTIYWNGTYVFTGNPSSETLLALFPKVNPTGFISIPLRWSQLYEKTIEEINKETDTRKHLQRIRNVVGANLRWGISAAGYLSPQIFRFFENNGIEICSGFGMTEATGGITMTPPGEYRENTTGIPLPGLRARLNDKSELEISGHYIARYLEDRKPGDIIEYPIAEEEDYWMPTGDIFTRSEEGYYTIVDRVKDIYKNVKGQTVAPRNVESKFQGVPGIKRTFLVGDGRAYNIIFIVPDHEDTLLIAANENDNIHEYFHQIVSAANKELAPYERVVNFAILDRDFSLDKGELTPKGSFNRKNIEKNFESLINDLYSQNEVILEYDGFQIVFPRWFFRDLGMLEDEIKLSDHGLFNLKNKTELIIHRSEEKDHVMIGDLEYELSSNRIDMGLFARQPLLWAANPMLINFCPCREGWDSSLKDISIQVYRPWDTLRDYKEEDLPDLSRVRDHELIECNMILSLIIFGDEKTALSGLERIEKSFTIVQDRLSELIRRRLETLARHPSEKIRCTAYKILLLEVPNVNYGKEFPSFLRSGLTFLNEESIEEIASTKLGKRRLGDLRRRLFNYRLMIDWPSDDVTREQFVKIFQLLINFVEHHPEYYSSIRAELASWILHKQDPELSKIAEEYFFKLSSNYEERLDKETSKKPVEEWEKLIYFEDTISNAERGKVVGLLAKTNFLKESIILAFDQQNFNIDNIEEKGIWISRLSTYRKIYRYRMSINMKTGKHYDLNTTFTDSPLSGESLEYIFWLAAISGYPYNPKVLPRLGCCLPEWDVRSIAYVGELSVWDRIRQLSGERTVVGDSINLNYWRKLFIEAFSTFFRGWRNSGYQILPGFVVPENVMVPVLDFQEGAVILSLSNIIKFKNTLSIIEPLHTNFFRKTIAHYPWCRPYLRIEWIFDALYDTLTKEEADKFIEKLSEDIKGQHFTSFDGRNFQEVLEEYVIERKNKFYVPLPLLNAIEKYGEWLKMSPLASPEAKDQTISELYRLYRLRRYDDIIRYYLYRYTYFAGKGREIEATFDALLEQIWKNPDTNVVNLIELTELQSKIKDKTDRSIFSRMVFPRFDQPEKVDIMKIGEQERGEFVIRTVITDKFGDTYDMRKAVDPTEIGQLYRLFYLEQYPKTISSEDQHYIVIDSQNRIVGGICYRIQEGGIAMIDGTVVFSPLKGRGIGTAMINDFIKRMSQKSIKIIKQHFIMADFFKKLGFKPDSRWGALVKIIG